MASGSCSHSAEILHITVLLVDIAANWCGFRQCNFTCPISGPDDNRLWTLDFPSDNLPKAYPCGAG
jgi:hypothetical protein